MSLLRNCAAGLLLAAFAAPAAFAAEPVAPATTIKIDELIRETQQSSSNPNKIDVVWWLPAEFWVAATADQSLPESERKELIQLFRDYTVVAVVVGDMGALGVKKFHTEAELRENLRLVDTSGREYTALPADKVDKRLGLMLQILKPMMASVVGELGNNLNFYAFPGKAKDGKRVADPLDTGKLVVKVDQTPYSFRLPLGSVMPARFDPATGDRFPGSYRFNPYTGATLQVSPDTGTQ